jgi:hypothetical protein
MKYHNLHIDTNGTFEKFDGISKLLGLEPLPDDKENKFAEPYNLWTYQVVTADEDEYFDFINKFLDILEPNFVELEILGIKKGNILFWLMYEYDQQCAMGFHPQEMKRLGESGIHLNFDCFQIRTDESTNA